MADTLASERLQFEAALFTLFEGIDTSGGGGGGSTPEITVTRASIINFTKAKLDEVIPEGEGISFSLNTSTNVSNPLDLLINANLDEAAKDVKLTAPLSAMKPVSAITYNQEGVENETDSKIGYVVLPDDYLRLHSFKMKEWKRQVTALITPEHPFYSKQANPYLRGGIEKPVGLLRWENVRTTEGEITTETMKKVIEYFSVDTSHIIEQLFIIEKEPAEDFIETNPLLINSLAWMCAAKILEITRLFDSAKMAMEQVKLSYTNLQ